MNFEVLLSFLAILYFKKKNMMAFRFYSEGQLMILKLTLTWEEKKMVVKFLEDRYADS